MTDPADWRRRLHLALQLHQAGRLGEALALYSGILQEQPDNDDALHLAGMALEQAGQPAKGLPLVEQAVARNPEIAAYRNSLGNIHRALDDVAAAEAAYAEAIRLQPDFAEAHNNLGLLAQAQQNWDEACRHFDAALAADPAFSDARFNHAVTDWMAGRHDGALTQFAAILQRHPGYAGKLGFLVRRGVLLQETAAAARLLELSERHGLSGAERHFLRGLIAAATGDPDAAEAGYRAALALQPDHGDALLAYGSLLLERQDFAQAQPVLERAQARQPDEPKIAIMLAQAHSGQGQSARAVALLQAATQQHPAKAGLWVELGQALSKLDRPGEAAQAYRQAIAVDPDNPAVAAVYANLAGAEIRAGNVAAAEAASHAALARTPDSLAALGNLANAYELNRRYDEAEAIYRRILQQHPDEANTHNNLGVMLLRLGRYAEAWPHYAWRWKSNTWSTFDSSRGLPKWDGRFPPPGRLLVWREQGVGDEILYAGLFPELAERGVDAVIATDRRLVPLFARSFPRLQVVANDSTRDPAPLGLACQCPQADLAAILRPDIAALRRHPAAYLKADPVRSRDLAARYRRHGRILVGISWASRNPRTGSGKSLMLDEMAPFLREPDADFISLQYGAATADVATLEAQTGLRLRHDPEIDPLADIDAQAAQIAALDLVVTVSTAAAHLAAALGIPTLILLPETRGQLWYWGERGETTGWYPRVRLCRRELDESKAAMVERAVTVFRQMRAALGGAGE